MKKFGMLIVSIIMLFVLILPNMSLIQGAIEDQQIEASMKRIKGMESISMASLIGLRQTVLVMRDAVQGVDGTMRMTNFKESMYMLASFRYGVWNFAIVTADGTPLDIVKEVIKGCTNCTLSISTLKDFLEAQGWKTIPATALPQTLKNAFLAPSLAAAIAAFANQTLTNIIVFPAIQGNVFPGLSVPVQQ